MFDHADYWVKMYLRLPTFFIGSITGYIMFYNKGRKSSANNFFKLIGWTLSLGFIAVHALNKIWFRSSLGKTIYEALCRQLWAISICWIIYACHQLASGGILRRFLSMNLWQPLSKLCLSTYLVHYIYLTLTFANQKDFQWHDEWAQIHIYVGDIIMSFAFGLILYIMVEAPSVRILQLIVGSK